MRKQINSKHRKTILENSREKTLRVYFFQRHIFPPLHHKLNVAKKKMEEKMELYNKKAEDVGSAADLWKCIICVFDHFAAETFLHACDIRSGAIEHFSKTTENKPLIKVKRNSPFLKQTLAFLLFFCAMCSTAILIHAFLFVQWISGTSNENLQHF